MVPSKVCDLAVEEFELWQESQGQIGQSGILKSETRNSTVRFSPDENWFEGIMYHHAIINNKWGIHVTGHERLQYATYVAGQFYNWHSDTFFQNLDIDRKLTVICSLNDEYDGGELMFLDTHVRLKKGEIIVFPSYLPHKVSPVTAGIRKSAVLWLTGPSFR